MTDEMSYDEMMDAEQEHLEELARDAQAMAEQEAYRVPTCFKCGWIMEWHGQTREIILDGEVYGDEPVYECVNPDCDDDED